MPLLSAVLLVTIPASAVAQAQAVPWRVVQGTDGTLYAITGGTRYELTPDPIGDADLAGLVDGGPVGGTLSAPDLSQAPAPPRAAAPTVQFVSVAGGRPGGTASATVQAAPGTVCTITYTTPAGTRSKAQGLVPRTTDANGIATWSWVIGTATRPGTGSVTVTCGGISVDAPIQIG